MQTVGLALAVLLVTETVVGWVLNLAGRGRLWELNLAQWELGSVTLLVESLGGLIDTLDDEGAAIGVDVGLRSDLIASQVVVTDEVLAWLVHLVAVGQLSAAQVNRECISTVVWAVVLTDLESVIGQIVVHGVGQVVASAEETEDVSVEVEELLLRVDLATTELLLHKVLHLWVVLARHWLLGDLEVILGLGLGGRKLTSLFLYKAFES